MSYKDQLQPLDIIVVYNPKSWLHRLIKGVTGYKAGHVALYTGFDEIYEAQSEGIHKTRVKTYPVKSRVYICRVMDLDIMQRNRIIVKCMALEGKKYAFLQLAMMWAKYTFKIKRVPDVSKKAMICSEFVARVFEEVDIDLSWKPSWEVTPGDILESKKVWRIECQ